MKSALLPFLNLDAATALALPLADVEARAQFRFCFHSPDGHATWLLARLCAIAPAQAGARFHHCIVLRPEEAEAERVFVAKNLRYRDGARHLDDWMTPDQAQNWDWNLYEQSCNKQTSARQLARFWIEEKGTLLKFGADGYGQIYEPIIAGEFPRVSERFIWRRGRDVPRESADVRFWDVSIADFHQQARALWESPDGPIQAAMRWAQLSDAEKEAIALGCERGSWAQLREVAAWVLTVYAAHSQSGADNYHWDFMSYGFISVNGQFLKGEEEQRLLAWRTALTESFGAHNVGAEGIKIDSLPLHLWSYTDNRKFSRIEIAPPTAHEAMEAQLKLRDWAHQHFAPDEAARLLELLAP